MSERFYAIVIGRDHLICQILNDDKVLQIETEEDNIEEKFITGITNEFIVLKNVYSLAIAEAQMMMIPFSGASYGSKYVTINKSQISEIYFLKKPLEDNVQAQSSGLTIN